MLKEIRAIAFTLMVLAGVLIPGAAHAKYHYRLDVYSLKAMEALTRLQIQEARRQLSLSMRHDPGNNIPYWLLNYTEFIEIVVTEDKALFDRYEKHRQSRIQRLSEGDPSSPYYQFCLAEIHIQWALSRSKFRQYLTAMREVNRCYSLLSDLSVKHPDFKPTLISMGFLHTIIGSIPSQYQWILKMLGFEGNVKKGIAEMHEAMQWSEMQPDRQFYNQQCLFFLSLIYLNADSDKTHAVAFMHNYMNKRSLRSENLEPLQAYALASIALKTGHNQLALRMLLNRNRDNGRMNVPYLDYMTGLAFLADGDPHAEMYLQGYASGFRGRNFIKAAWQRLAWFYLLDGNPGRYRDCMKNAGTKGFLDVDADKAAQRDYESGVMPNPLLLKARLLSDGGYYDRAQKVLQVYFDGGHPDAYNDLEAHYRQARLYDETGQNQSAIKSYQQVFAAGRNDHRYFAANSALKLGALYERLGRNDMAALWYQRVQELDFSEYRNSISQKARAGYERTRK